MTARLAHEVAEHEEPREDPEVSSDAVLAALATLSERDQEALRLVYWDGLSALDAARALGCTAVAMRVRLHRARGRLGRALAARGVLTHLTPTEA
jgi:RNA polymerase sigma-70 factor (ECF subfamily)